MKAQTFIQAATLHPFSLQLSRLSFSYPAFSFSHPEHLFAHIHNWEVIKPKTHKDFNVSKEDCLCLDYINVVIMMQRQIVGQIVWLMHGMFFLLIWYFVWY